jgi:hypothetical protein
MVLSVKRTKFVSLVAPKEKLLALRKPTRSLNANLARQMAEVQVLREQVRKAEAKAMHRWRMGMAA